MRRHPREHLRHPLASLRRGRGDQIGGIAVHIGARVAAAAAPDETLVTDTVVDLVVGSPLRFADRGQHSLEVVPGEWRLLAVQA